MIQNSYNDTPSLYLIPTPIGNLDDITYRAVKVLEEVEVIFSEDTRVTLNLLNNFGIKKKLISLHEHNEDILKEKVLEYLKNGYSVGLVTDRGTPIISDPGYKTVKYNNTNPFEGGGGTSYFITDPSVIYQHTPFNSVMLPWTFGTNHNSNDI